MTAKENARERLRVAHQLLQSAQEQVQAEQKKFAEVCREIYPALNDREMAEETGYSRARIQQFRKGDPRRGQA